MPNNPPNHYFWVPSPLERFVSWKLYVNFSENTWSEWLLRIKCVCDLVRKCVKGGELAWAFRRFADEFQLNFYSERNVANFVIRFYIFPSRRHTSKRVSSLKCVWNMVFDSLRLLKQHRESWKCEGIFITFPPVSMILLLLVFPPFELLIISVARGIKLKANSREGCDSRSFRWKTM